MKILNKSLAVFWRSKGTVQQFHADLWILPGEAVAAAIARYRAAFPADTICSVRDSRGRFVPFASRSCPWPVARRGMVL